jgi:hypothetical protein
VPDVPRDAEPLLQTGALRYRLVRHDIGYSAAIDYAFHNRTGSAVVLDQCGDEVRPLLQVKRQERWVDAWHPLADRCEGETLVVPAGGMYVDTLRVVGAPPGSNLAPTFVFEHVEGTYRLYWFQARLAPTHDSVGAEGPPVDDWRVSNPFVLAFR